MIVGATPPLSYHMHAPSFTLERSAAVGGDTSPSERTRSETRPARAYWSGPSIEKASALRPEVPPEAARALLARSGIPSRGGARLAITARSATAPPARIRTSSAARRVAHRPPGPRRRGRTPLPGTLAGRSRPADRDACLPWPLGGGGQTAADRSSRRDR